jgi:hypothetical protein
MFISKEKTKSLKKLESKKYLYWVDLMRSFGISTMVMAHCNAHIYLSLGLLPLNFFYNQFWLLAVPVFTFLSGFTMVINHSQNENYKLYLKRKLKYIIPNYLIWGTLVSFFSLFFIYIDKNQFANFADFITYIVEALFKVLTGNVNIIYFSYIIIQFYIIFPFLLKLIDKFKRPFIFYFLYMLFLLGFLLFSIYVLDFMALSDLNFKIQISDNTRATILFLRHSPVSKIFIGYLSFFILGMICAKKRDFFSKIGGKSLIVIVLLPLYIFFYIIINYNLFGSKWTWFLNIIFSNYFIFMEFLIISQIKFSRKKQIENQIELSQKRKNSKNFKYKILIGLWKLGLSSAGIYYIHIFIAYFVQLFIAFLMGFIFLIPSINQSIFIYLIISFITAILILFICYKIVNYVRKKVEKSRYIIGI